MSLKKTDLAKNLGLKISSQIKQAGVPGRYGDKSQVLPDRREQRKLDQAAGLVPFAVKLHGDLVKQLQEQALREGMNLNTLVDHLIRAGLDAQPEAAAPAAKAPAKKSVATAEKASSDKATVKKATVKKAAAPKPAAKKAAAKKG